MYQLALFLTTTSRTFFDINSDFRLSETRKNFVDFGLNETFFKDDLHILTVPEIKEIVLNVCIESIPQEFKFAGTLNYQGIVEKLRT